MATIASYFERPFEPSNMAASTTNSPLRIVSLDSVFKLTATIVTTIAIPIMAWLVTSMMNLGDRVTRVEIDSRYLQTGIGDIRQDIKEMNGTLVEIRKELKK